MIEINLSDLDKESLELLNMLTDNKGKELRKEMIKFLKENHYPQSSAYNEILEFINDFFFVYKPENEE
jgi:hypothetical protein